MSEVGKGRRTKSFDDVADRLARHHGITRQVASARLHKFKKQTGRGGADNLVFDLTGGMYDDNGEFLGTLTDGGSVRSSK